MRGRPLHEILAEAERRANRRRDLEKHGPYTQAVWAKAEYERAIERRLIEEYEAFGTPKDKAKGYARKAIIDNAAKVDKLYKDGLTGRSVGDLLLRGWR